MDSEEFLGKILGIAGVAGLRPKTGSFDRGFRNPGDFVISALVGFGYGGISERNFGKCRGYRITPKKSADLTTVSVIQGDFVIPGLVGFGS